jgi:hypothetical protein
MWPKNFLLFATQCCQLFAVLFGQFRRKDRPLREIFLEFLDGVCAQK